jgi:CHAD domain-containing protein
VEEVNITRQFVFPPGSSPSGLLRRIRQAGYTPGSPAISRGEALFLDTQDGRLFKGQYRLSIRRLQDGRVWHLSGPSSESRHPVADTTPFPSLPSDSSGIPEQVKELVGGRCLIPLLRLKVVAWDTSLRDPSGDIVALRIERFLAAPPRGRWPKGVWPHGLLTIRPLEGPSDALLHLAAYLRDRVGLLPTEGDACQVALQALDLPEPGAPIPARLRLCADDPLAAAARKVVAQQIWKMEANIPGTLEDADAEFLHDLRVATRRLRSALRLFAEVLGPKRCESLRVELSWIAGHLGAVRDLDVFIQNLHGQAERLGDGAAVAGVLAEELDRRRVPARSALVAALTSRRFGALTRRLKALASSSPPRFPRGPQGVPVSEAAPVLLLKAQKRVLKLGRTIGPASPATDLHRLRILCKRLRYACEFFREAFADPASGKDPVADFIESMVRFQDCLGEHQDAVVAIGRIQELADAMVQRGALSPARLLDLGSLIQVQREIANQRRDLLLTLWRRFDKRSVRNHLTELEPRSPAAPRSGAVSAAGGEGGTGSIGPTQRS